MAHHAASAVAPHAWRSEPFGPVAVKRTPCLVVHQFQPKERTSPSRAANGSEARYWRSSPPSRAATAIQSSERCSGAKPVDAHRRPDSAHPGGSCRSASSHARVSASVSSVIRGWYGLPRPAERRSRGTSRRPSPLWHRPRADVVPRQGAMPRAGLASSHHSWRGPAPGVRACRVACPAPTRSGRSRERPSACCARIAPSLSTPRSPATLRSVGCGSRASSASIAGPPSWQPMGRRRTSCIP